MNEKDFDALIAAIPVPVDPNWDVTVPKTALYPFFDIDSRSASMACIFHARVSHGKAEHTVIVAARMNNDAPEFNVWCGDKFMDRHGGMTAEQAQARCAEAVASSSAPLNRATELMQVHDVNGASDDCAFWLNWRRSKSLCVHTMVFLRHLQATQPDFKAKLLQGYEDALVTAPGEPTGDTLGLSELAFKVPVLIEGDRGAGKTVEARAFARNNSYARVELGGHEGTEALDMLGYSLQAPSGAMVWKDGALSEAFRLAKTTKVVLIIDELLRIRVRELSIFLTALSPDEGMYRLRTGRILDVVDGVAREEELECPVSNLCIIATTNVGAEYSVDEIDPALAERFVVLRKDTSEAELKRILTQEVKAKGFKLSVVTLSLKFYNKMAEARLRGLVARTPTTRTLVRAVALANVEADVLRLLRTQTLLWVARTSEGQPVPEQVATVDGLLTRFWK